MTSIDIPRDDLRVLDLKLDNATSEAVKPAKQVQPYPNMADRNPIQEIKRDHVPNKEQRRKHERRQSERRQMNEPVLLDTRENRDRRQHDRRQSDHAAGEPKSMLVSARKGFDAYA